MSGTTESRSAVNGLRTALGIGGITAVIVGILILVWPDRSAAVLTAIIAIYAIVGGLIYGGLGIFAKDMRGWSRVGHIILGLVFIAAGIFAFANLAGVTVGFFAIIAIFIGILWIVEGVVAFSTLSSTTSRGWTIFFAIISLIAGITLIISPVFGAGVLWWLLGISMVVLGVIQVFRAFTFGRNR